MGMNPTEFLEAFVEGNLGDCLDQPGDVRRAFNAAVSASHLADQFFVFHKRHNPRMATKFANIGTLVEHLEHISDGAFRDIRSISNAYKHLYTDVESRHGAHASVDSSGSIYSVELDGDQDVSEMSEELGAKCDESDAQYRVTFTRRDGSKADFLSTLNRAVSCLRDIVYDRT